MSFHPRVDKQYVEVLEATATVEHSTTDLEWEQIYKGIARGLGGINENITECVNDGDKTIETFRDAFTAFEDREIFEGTHVHVCMHGMYMHVHACIQYNVCM